MVEKDALKSAYLAVMSNLDNIILRALNMVSVELKKDNDIDACKAVLDTASLCNALFTLQTVYRAKFEHVGEEADDNE